MKELPTMRKFNMQGFSHHFILPVIVVIAIGGIGAYLLTQSKAATPNGKIIYSPDSINGIRSIKADGSEDIKLTETGGYEIRRTHFSNGIDYTATYHNCTATITRTDSATDISTFNLCSNASDPSYHHIHGITFKNQLSADGKPILTISTVNTPKADSGPKNTTIQEIDIDGTNQKILVTLPYVRERPAIVRQMAWGPTDNKLFYLPEYPGTSIVSHAINAYNASTKKSQEVVREDILGSFDLSADGKKIAYNSSAGLKVIGAGGAGKKLLDGSSYAGAALSINNDGSMVAYVNYTPKGSGYIYKLMRIKTDGTGRKQLAAAERINKTSWSPNSELIMYGAYMHDSKSTKLITIRPNGDGKRVVKSLPASYRDQTLEFAW